MDWFVTISSPWKTWKSRVLCFGLHEKDQTLLNNTVHDSNFIDTNILVSLNYWYTTLPHSRLSRSIFNCELQIVGSDIWYTYLIMGTIASCCRVMNGLIFWKLPKQICNSFHKIIWCTTENTTFTTWHTEEISPPYNSFVNSENGHDYCIIH